MSLAYRKLFAFVIHLILNISYYVSALSSCQPSGPFPEPLAVVPSENQRYMVVLLPMHFTNSWYPNKCGKLSYKSLLMLEALMYARDTITRRHNNVVDYPLGLMAMDTCDDGGKAEKDVENFETCSLTFASANGPVHPDFAVFYLNAAYQDNFGPLNNQFDNIYKKPHSTFSVGSEIQVNLLDSLVHLMKYLQLHYAATIVSFEFQKNNILPYFDNVSRQNELCNEYFNLMNQPTAENYYDVLRKIDQNKDHKAILLLTNGKDTAKLFDAAMVLNISLNFRWIGFAGSMVELDGQITLPPGCIVLAREINLEPFYSYLDMKRRGELMLLRNPWMEEYLVSKCNASKITDCETMLAHFHDNQWLQYNDFISEVIIRYDAASIAWSELQKSRNINTGSEFKLMQVRTEAVKERLQTLAVRNVMILNYQQTSRDWHFVRVGTLANDQITDLQGIWSYSDRPLDHSVCTHNCDHCPLHLIIAAESSSSLVTPGAAPSYLSHKNDIWACILAGLTGLSLCFIVSYEVYALTKICVNLSHGSPASQSGIFLGQVLLFSIFLMTLSIYSFTFEANYQICTVKRFVPSVANVLCFGNLFVKVLVLISVKKGQFLSACYQALMLVLIVVIQTIVNVQWLVNSPVSLIFNGHRWICATSFDDHLKILVFPFCLIILCCIAAFIMRKNPYNYRENIYITIVSGLCALVWSIWITIGKLLNHKDIEDMSMGFGMFAASTLLLFIMFFPRSRQRTAMGEGLGLHPEDVVSIKTSFFNTGTNLWTTNSNSISPSISEDSPSNQSHRMKQDDSLLIPTTRLKTSPSSGTMKNIVIPIPSADYSLSANDLVGSVATLDVPPLYAMHVKPTKFGGALKKATYTEVQQSANKVVTFNHKPLMIEPIEETDPGLHSASNSMVPTPATRATISRATLRRIDECSNDYSLTEPRKSRVTDDSKRAAAMRLSDRLRASAFAYRSHSLTDLGRNRQLSNLHISTLMYQSRSFSDLSQDQSGGIRP